MLNETEDIVRQDAEALLRKVNPEQGIGLCCINMDFGTPDANVRAVIDAAGRG